MQKIFNMIMATAMMLLIISCSKDDSNPVEPTSNNYPSVKIGNQIWMAENLKVTKLNNGKEISKITKEAVASEAFRIDIE